MQIHTIEPIYLLIHLHTLNSWGIILLPRYLTPLDAAVDSLSPGTFLTDVSGPPLCPFLSLWAASNLFFATEVKYVQLTPEILHTFQEDLHELSKISKALTCLVFTAPWIRKYNSSEGTDFSSWETAKNHPQVRPNDWMTNRSKSNCLCLEILFPRSQKVLR